MDVPPWAIDLKLVPRARIALLRDGTRPSRIPPLAPEAIERVVKMTLHEPPGEATHWSSRAIAAASGVRACR